MFTEHYSKNYKKLVGKAQGALGDFHYGQDCVHEAYENAIKYHENFDEDRGNFDLWFNSIFYNCIKKYANFIRDKGINMDDDLKDHPNFPPDLVQKYPKTIMMEISKHSTSQKQEEVLTCYLLLGYTGSELEYLLGVKPNSALRTVNRFKQHLLTKYKE